MLIGAITRDCLEFRGYISILTIANVLQIMSFMFLSKHLISKSVFYWVNYEIERNPEKFIYENENLI